MLARAVKDHERRDGTKEGFSGTPGDCLAYKYYRDVSKGWCAGVQVRGCSGGVGWGGAGRGGVGWRGVAQGVHVWLGG